MRIGIAKMDAGFPPSSKKIRPVNPEDVPKEKRELLPDGQVLLPIVKGVRYWIPDDYDFSGKDSHGKAHSELCIFAPDKAKEAK